MYCSNGTTGTDKVPCLENNLLPASGTEKFKAWKSSVVDRYKYAIHRRSTPNNAACDDRSAGQQPPRMLPN